MAKGATKYFFITALLLLHAFPAVLAQQDQAYLLPRSGKNFITVDQSGNGDHKNIQAAIDAVPSNNAGLVFIWVKPGVYKEKVVVPRDKPFITISGTGTAKETIITWDECGDINQTAVFSVLATDFIGRFLTFQNTHGSGAKAVALRVSADRAAFYACRILSHQDALFDDIGRHYYSNCYIEGDTDFIFGSAASFYEKCHLHSLSKQEGVITGAITAQRRNSPSEQSGFTFVGGKVTGVEKAVLGRPWGPYSTVVFAYTYMSNVVLPQGWDHWNIPPEDLSNIFYGEYKCYGPGAVTSKRVDWAQDLARQDVVPFLTQASYLRSESWQGRRLLLHPYRVGGTDEEDLENIVSEMETERLGLAPTPTPTLAEEDTEVGWDAAEWGEDMVFSSGCGYTKSRPCGTLLLSFFFIILRGKGTLEWR